MSENLLKTAFDVDHHIYDTVEFMF